MITILRTNASPQPVKCRACGSVGTHLAHPGKGPHFKELRCRQCDCHIKWLSRQSAAAYPSITKTFIVDNLMWIHAKRPACAQILGELVLQVWLGFREA